MAAPGREPNSGLASPAFRERLRADAGAFEFFQAVRLVQLAYPDKPTVGGFDAPGAEAVQFSVESALAFPPSAILALLWDGELVRMTVAFMGLTGRSGVLPYCYSEFIVSRQRSKDHALAAFFDIFNNRIVALFYRAWEKYRIPVAFERARRRAEGHDRFASKLLSLVGLATPGLQHQNEHIHDEALVDFAGLLSLQPRSATALRQVLEQHFNVPVEIDQFVGCWRQLNPADQCIFSDLDMVSMQLGSGAVLGDEIWDQQCRARVRIGPLNSERYRQFLPSGNAHRALKAFLDFFSNREIEFEIQLVLQRERVPVCQLGVDTEVPPLLGWLTWMKSAPQFDRDAADTIFLLEQEQ